MSGVVDEDTASAINTGREALGVVLRTVQKKLQKVFIFFAVGLLGGIVAMRSVVWPTLKADLLARGADVIAQTPFDVILLQIKIGLIVGVLMVIPPLLYFLREPLAERGAFDRVDVSRWQVSILGFAGLALFVGGILYAYYLFFPIMFSFLANNAQGAGFAPHYSIVHWTQFIMVLGFSFGLAAQLPLVMPALSYTGIVPYETFRDKWKYAIVSMFAFGALFSPPDPFTQLMWGTPLVILYAISLYLSKIVVTAKRGRESTDITGEIRARWNRVAGFGVLGGAAVYGFFSASGAALVNDSVLPVLPGSIRPDPLPPIEEALGMPRGTATLVVAGGAAVVVGLLALLYYVYTAIEAAASAQAAMHAGGPVAIDLETLNAEGVRAAPPEPFAAMSEEEALMAAQDAMDDGDDEKARVILDRYDEVSEGEDGDGGEGDAAPEAAEEDEGVFTRTTTGMVDAFTEEETTEDDIGGYYHDIAFVFDSLRSRAFRIAAVFMVVMAGVFAWLYQGGIGAIRCDFLSRLPAEVAVENCGPISETAARRLFSGATQPAGSDGVISMDIVTLHPVEALVFEVKLSTVIAIFAILPFLLYYAWPALAERGVVTGNRKIVGVWGGAITAGLLVGTVFGYSLVAPNIISWLVADAYAADMVIAYRVNNFFWLVFLTTVGIGLLADIPITMLLFHAGGVVSYHSMRRRWRIVAIGTFAVAGLVTPDSLYTMFLIAVPTCLAYGLGLALLWAFTLGGRRGRSGPTVEEPTA